MSPIRSSAGGRFAKDTIVAVVLALPEPFAALALMDGRIEFRDRQELAATDERSFVTQALEVGENIVDASLCEMAVLTLEDEQWRTLAQYSLGPLQNVELGAFGVDLEQPDLVVFAEIFIQRYQRHGEGFEVLAFERLAAKRRPGLMAPRHEQILHAGMRIDGFGFHLHIVEFDDPADFLQTARQFRLRLESDDAAIPAPARQPIDETALVGPDVTGDIGGMQMLTDDAEFDLLITKTCLQRSDPEPDAPGCKPGSDN